LNRLSLLFCLALALSSCTRRQPGALGSAPAAHAPVAEKWRFAGSIVSEPAVGPDGTVYVGAICPGPAGQYCLLALGADGKPLWSIEGTVGGFRESMRMYVGVSPSGTVYAFDIQGGMYIRSELGAQFRTAPEVAFQGPPVFPPDGAVLVGSNRGLLAVVNGPNGPEANVRIRPFNGSYAYTPAVGPDGTLYFSTSYGGRMLAVDPFGSVRWTLRLGEQRPVVDQLGTVCGRTDKGLMSVAADGRVLWEFRVEAKLSGLVAGPDGTYYVGDTQGYLYAVSREGRQAWAVRLSTRLSVDSVAGPVDGVLYASTLEGLTAVSSDGRILWRHDAGKGGTFSVAIGPEGFLLVRASVGLIALSAS
jgi:outer membrane protein assembly factor BamB